MRKWSPLLSFGLLPTLASADAWGNANIDGAVTRFLLTAFTLLWTFVDMLIVRRRMPVYFVSAAVLMRTNLGVLVAAGIEAGGIKA
jgi:hypothetical protein